MTQLIVIMGAGLLAAGITFVCNWFALQPWRRNRQHHWTERARLAYPAFAAARSNLLFLPAVFVFTVLLVWPNSSPLWFFTGFAAVLGAYAGTLPMDHEVFPRIFVTGWLRRLMVSLTLRFLIWLVLIGATIWMPYRFNGLTLTLVGTVFGLWAFMLFGGFLWLGRKLDFYAPAPERLLRIATETSTRMNIPVREVLLLRSAEAQALALPQSRRVIFTERILEILPDDELAGVCAHELAHLTESKAAYYSRMIRMFAYLPWMFFNPLIHAFGMMAFFGLLFTTLGIPRICQRISLKLEKRADQMAKDHTPDPAIYTRALVRLHEDRLLPAILAKKNRTHPDLYDRILAAGVTPDFPRPQPAKSIATHGTVFAAIFGMLFALFALKIMNLSPNLTGH